MAETLQSIREGEEIPKEIEKEKAALSTQKTRILDDKIFQAIADIAFFFNVIGTHPEIQHEFDDDIQELLGVRRKLPEPMTKTMAINQITQRYHPMDSYF